jgi:hypothetical protein
VTSKSLITPSRRGRMATISAGVRPTISLASRPMASTFLLLFSMATTEGSLMTMPLFRTLTNVLAVPRSMPMSCEKMPRIKFNGLNTRFPSLARCQSVGMTDSRLASSSHTMVDAMRIDARIAWLAKVVPGHYTRKAVTRQTDVQ